MDRHIAAHKRCAHKISISLQRIFHNKGISYFIPDEHKITAFLKEDPDNTYVSFFFLGFDKSIDVQKMTYMGEIDDSVDEKRLSTPKGAFNYAYRSFWREKIESIVDDVEDSQ